MGVSVSAGGITLSDRNVIDSPPEGNKTPAVLRPPGFLFPGQETGWIYNGFQIWSSRHSSVCQLHRSEPLYVSIAHSTLQLCMPDPTCSIRLDHQEAHLRGDPAGVFLIGVRAAVSGLALHGLKSNLRSICIASTGNVHCLHVNHPIIRPKLFPSTKLRLITGCYI
jgi:hypothetical protein